MASSNEVSKEMLQITIKKAKPSDIGRLPALKKNELILNRLKALADDGHNNGDSKSDVSIILEGEDLSNNYGKIVVSKAQSSITEETNVSSTPPNISFSHNKEEIARYIIDEIFSRCDVYNSRKESDNLNRKSIRTSGHSKNYDSTLIGNMGEPRKRRLSSVVPALDLPISLPETKTPGESRPRLEKPVLDAQVAISATIIGNQGDKNHEESPSDVNIETKKEKELSTVDSPFDLCWCFGFNEEVPVVNLSDDESSQVVFANSMYAVIYDFHENSMLFLQGHMNTVSCVSSNSLGKLVVTADSGWDIGTSRVIVWDRRPCVLQVLDNVHPYGCQHVALSTKGDFIVTVSANENPACINIWEWMRDSKAPAATVSVKESLGSVKRLTIRSASNGEFALTYDRCVVFVQVIWQTIFQGYLEAVRVKEKIIDCESDICAVTAPKIGALTDTTFVEYNETVAFSSTCKGYVIVWENNLNQQATRIYRKYVRLHLDCISSIQVVDEKIAVATVSGNVSFYDFELKILFSHKLFSERVASVSFNLSPQYLGVTKCQEHMSCANTWKREPRELEDATLEGEPFSVRHFIVSTESGRMAYVNASCGTPKYLSFPSKEQFTALDISPNSNYLFVGTASGKCILFDVNQRKVKVTKQISDNSHIHQDVSCIRYSPSGYIVGCGMRSGNIWLLDPVMLTPILNSPLIDCNGCITHMAFTSDSEYLIVSDDSFSISVFFIGEQPLLVRQYVAHYKPIVALNVEANEGDKEIKVSTLSSDRSICQFLLDREKRSFEFILHQQVEQTAVPMYSVYYPSQYSSEGTYLGVNSNCKFKVHDNPSFNPAKGRSYRRCRGTFQAPDFGSPINYLEVFGDESKPYLFFKTTNHIGLHVFPIDGNPFGALGFKASATALICSKVSPNGKYVFTISEYCSGISMWRINTRAVDDFYKSGGEGLEPFLKVLGEEKEQEIREFFDLGQFLHQGERPSLVRTLQDSLPICEMANVLQALGCMLTRYDIYELIHEVLSSENYEGYIEYDSFVRLYINYRKHNKLDLRDLRKAFRDFHAGVYTAPCCINDVDPVFDSSSLIGKLLATGEEMTHAELYADFSILTGGQPDPPEEEYMMYQAPPTMPKEITFKTFVKDILGFPVDDTMFKE
ncbi:cilia- and flagella-associated protein 251-like [Macrosteles quadrilineatus]|uniref:cilia- and flagella-associated protein 251-like n=1 Tax=Macrosteles quadrilineatus TaxID=74068 RepID=UPI0023E31486|nr:cilia- and flagella-associated protein 251-like [Macrosteles quadrilineatus]